LQLPCRNNLWYLSASIFRARERTLRIRNPGGVCPFCTDRIQRSHHIHAHMRRIPRQSTGPTLVHIYLLGTGRSDAMSHQPLVSIPWNAGKMKQLILPTINNISYWGQPCYGTAQTCVLPRNGANCLKGYTVRTLLLTLRTVLMPNLSFKKKTLQAISLW